MSGIEDQSEVFEEGEEYNEPPPPNSVYIRVSLPDQKIQVSLVIAFNDVNAF
jgi:hypothetical protein